MGSIEKSEEISILLKLPVFASKTPATDKTKFTKDHNYFHTMDHREPHAIRRDMIMRTHPEIESLIKREPYTSLFFTCLIHFIQLSICWVICKYDWTWFSVVPFALTIGAIFNHGLFVLIHDITHFNCFSSVKYNQIAAIFANLPQIIPSAIAFGRYHKDHHVYLGDPVLDPDIPSVLEIKVFRTPIAKLLFILFEPFFYALRPYFKTPKTPCKMEIVNIVSCVVFGILVNSVFGYKSLIYLLLCTYFGLSVHPVSAHLIAEHYEFNKSQDTFSYYGIINYLNFNMGYHVEHHDFPSIPWYNLPKVRKIAPEFYENLPVIDSYVKILYKYIFDSEIGPWSRIAIGDNKEKLK